MTTVDLNDLEQLAHEFCNNNDASRNPREPDAVKCRLFLGMFIIWLKQQKTPQKQTNWHAGYCRLHPNHDGHCSIR